MKSVHLTAILVIIFVCCMSCNKDNQTPSTNDKLLHCTLNEYLPIDTNKIWIYNKMVKVYDDVISDGIDETTTTNTNDTTFFSKEYLKDKFFARKFNDNFYFTTGNSISVLFDSSFFLSDLTYVTLAFTNKADTTWQQTINAKNFTVILTFNQSLNKSKPEQDEILINVKNGEFLTLFQSYVFKRNVGMINKHLNAMNTEIEYSFVKTQSSKDV